MEPRDFFNQYVRPARADCEAEPAALHRAVSALINIDALAGVVWNATNPTKEPFQYREKLKSMLIELAYAWDVHDIHKHGVLTRRTPILPNGRRPEVMWVGRCIFG